MQTETECGDGSNDWAAAEHTFALMRHYFNNGAKLIYVLEYGFE